MSNGPLGTLVKQDSRNAAWLGNAIGWQGLEDEANHNVKNPGRAMTKAAISAATWYLGGEAAGALGSGAGAAADAAGTAATAGSMTAEQLAAQAAQQAAQDAAESGGSLALNAAGNATVNAATPLAPGLLASAPQGLGNTMESAMTDSGYTPSSLFQAFKNASSANATPLSQNLANYGKELQAQATNGGLLNRVGSNLGSSQSQGLMKLGAGMLSPPGQQQPPPRGMPAPQGQQGPLPSPYGQPNNGGPNSLTGTMPPPGMSYAEFLRRKQLGLI